MGLLPCVHAADRNAAAVKKKRSVDRVLALLSKDPATWKVIAGGPRGTLSYNEETGRFTFNGTRLKPLAEYALVQLTNLPPYGHLLATGTVGQSGELQLNGVWKDWNQKFWLVLKDDISIVGNALSPKAWHPEQYLFEEKVLGIPCDCED